MHGTTRGLLLPLEAVQLLCSKLRRVQIEDTKRKQLIFAEEMAGGGTLLQEMRHAHTNDNTMLATVFRQLFDAVAHLHDPAAGCCCILHRDIKV